LWRSRALWSIFGPNTHPQLVHKTPLAVLKGGVREIVSADARPPSFADLPTESFHQYSGAACVRNVGSSEAIVSLDRSLANIPTKARTHLLENHLYFGNAAEIRSEVSDTNNDLVSTGRSSYYHAKWAIHRQGKREEPLYSVCVAVSGLEFVAGETVAGYTNTTTHTLVGVRRENCNLFGYCDEVPVVTEVTTQAPVFKRHLITLEEQTRLKGFIESLVDYQITRQLE